MSKKIDPKLEQKLEELRIMLDISNLEAEKNRSRSVTVGTAFGGVTEISMRSKSGQVLWTHLQPVEVIELIHQMSANIGCHIHIVPRKDFASWRGWKESDPQLSSNSPNFSPLPNGTAPWPQKDTEPNEVATTLPTPEIQAGMSEDTQTRSKKHVVATEKLKNRRNIKRTSKAS